MMVTIMRRSRTNGAMSYLLHPCMPYQDSNDFYKSDRHNDPGRLNMDMNTRNRRGGIARHRP